MEYKVRLVRGDKPMKAGLSYDEAVNYYNKNQNMRKSFYFLDDEGNRLDGEELVKNKPRKRRDKPPRVEEPAREISEDTSRELPSTSERDPESPTVRDIKRDK